MILKMAESTGMSEAELTKIYEEATRGTITDDGEALEQQQLEEKAEADAMKSGREKLDDRKYLRFFDNDSEDMFDEIMSVLTTANPNDMSSQASDLANLLGFNDFNNTFDDNLASFAAAIQAIKETDASQSADAAARLEKLVEAIGQLDGQYKERFFRSDEKTASMNEENVDDRKAMIESINALIDALRNPQ